MVRPAAFKSGAQPHASFRQRGERLEGGRAAVDACVCFAARVKALLQPRLSKRGGVEAGKGGGGPKQAKKPPSVAVQE